MREFDPEAEPEMRRYVHRLYRPGLNVYVDPSIREIHPRSAIAGHIVKVAEGLVYKLLDPFDDYDHKVPVIFGGEVWYVEEQYVFAD